MARLVKAATGQRGLALPNGKVIAAGQTSVLSDADWAVVAALVSSGALLDMGASAATPDVPQTSEKDPVASAALEAYKAEVKSTYAPVSGSPNYESPTHAAATFSRPQGAGVGRFVAKALRGGAVKVVGVGDSVTAGTGATLGTNDFLTLVKNALTTRFPSATVTQSNRGLSGATVATNVINSYFANAVTDAADLYVLMFGKNDTVADAYAVPVQGYPLAQSIRGLEVMVRRLRTLVPGADIIIAAENPNTASDATGNAKLQAWNAEAQALAAAYGCEWVDCYNAFTAKGDYSTYLTDSVHPSVAGHQLIADTIMASIPTTALPAAQPAASPVNGVKDAASVDEATGLNGWVVRQDPGASQNGVWVNSGTWSGSNPYVTTTATDYVEFTFVGTEFALRMSTATADALVVDVAVDGVTTQTNLAMTTLPSAYQPFVVLAKGLTALQHKVRVTLKSGTFRVYQAAWLSARIPQVSRERRRMITNRYYGSDPYVPATAAPSAGWAYVVPVFIPRTHTINQIACEVTTAAAGATVNLGIYGSDEYDQPLGLVVDAGAVDASTTGFKTLTIANVALTPGWYWLAALSLGGAPALRSNNTSHELVTTNASTTANAFSGYLATGPLTALPARWTATLAGANAPRVLVRPT